MARYIDADKFIERLKASPAFPNMGMDGYFLLDVVENLLKKFPTADVAPKSEVERLTDLNNQLESDIINANMNLEHITKEFQEVARKIIDEFDEELHKLAERYYEQGKIEYFTLCEVIYRLVIAKIKNKYKEEKE